jgi:hypothetical protein
MLSLTYRAHSCPANVVLPANLACYLLSVVCRLALELTLSVTGAALLTRIHQASS